MKKYLNEKGYLCFVSQGIGRSAWMTVYQKSSIHGTHRVKAIPIKMTQEAAQAELDAYAAAKKWKDA